MSHITVSSRTETTKKVDAGVALQALLSHLGMRAEDYHGTVLISGRTHPTKDYVDDAVMLSRHREREILGTIMNLARALGCEVTDSVDGSYEFAKKGPVRRATKETK